MQIKYTLIIIALFVFAATDLNAQCSNLQLKANRTTGCAPDIISLNITGAPSGSTFTWTIGNDTKSGKDQINYSFQNKGVYDVSVCVTFPNSQNCVVKKTNFITIGEVPKNLSFSISSTKLCQPDTVTFTGPPGMKQYDWLIEGKNNLNSGQKLTYRLTSPGYKSVTLRVTDPTGCIGLKTMDSVIYVAAPPSNSMIADVRSGCAPLEVNFKPNVVDGSSKVISYSWSFPGGSPSSSSQAQPPVIKYNSVGSYDVTLKVVTQSGCSYSITNTGYIKVGNGATPSFTVDKRSGKKSDIFNFQNTTSGLGSLPGTFSWNFSGGVAQTGSDQKKQMVQFNAGGKYTIYLTYQDNGCSVTEKKIEYIEIIDTTKPKPNPCSTVVASFNIAKNDFCIGDSVKITNLSKSNLNKYKWSADKPGIKFFPYDTSMEPVILLSTIDTFQVKLQVQGPDTCKAEQIMEVRTLSPDATFISSDTVNACAPAYVSFTYTGQGADSFYWDFGDSIKLTTNTGNIGHIYKTNTGYDLTKGFTVKLTVKTKTGCMGMYEQKNYIKVTGPKPDFGTAGSKNIGTEPFNVTFVNRVPKSYFYVFNYGDSTKTDTNTIQPHNYYVNDSGQAFQVYKPNMFVKDSTGCSATGESTDSVIVYKKPITDFTDSIIYSCENISVQFTDKSRYAVKWEWDFEDDGTVDDTTQNPVHNFSPGTFRTKLTVANAIGDTDTKIIEDTIKAIQQVDASFTVSKSEGCINDTFLIKADNISADIKKIKWVVSNGSDSSVYTDTSSISIQLKKPGIYSISLWEENNSGCQDTVIKTNSITISDTIISIQPRISYVTFLEKNDVKIAWRKSTVPGAKYYFLYKKTGGTEQLIYTALTENDTVYIDKNVDTSLGSPPTYVLKSGNICGKESGPSKEHIAILLNTTSTSIGCNNLKWSSYFGWKDVSEYQIYRAGGKDTFSLIATVPGTQTDYNDSNLCRQEYKYFVKAKSPNGIYFSASNLSTGNPTGQGKPDNILLNYVSVVDDNSIVIEWQPSKMPKTKRYIIDKYTQWTGWRENYASTENLIWKDNMVDVKNESYKYRIRVEDECGNTSVHSNAGRSILLSSKVKGDRIYLYWHPYGVWDKGIKNQIVQLKVGNSPFRTLPSLDGNDSTLIDYIDKNDPNGSYCYRILAVENDNMPDSSSSNISCIMLPSKLYIPTAFTPNGDGLNDEFKVSAHAIHNITGNTNLDFQLHIYDRNGQKVFETHDVKKGWDGTVSGFEAPEGNYTFMIYSIGQDKERYYIEGTLTLLRALR